MKDIIGLIWGECYYPALKDFFNENNHIFKMIEYGFYQMGMDANNYGKVDWNPLSEIVSEGDTVLIKPNMVLDSNRGKGGIECLYTHPSVVVPVIKYVSKALNGTGRIIIGDAPLQDCNFDKLVNESGYIDVVEHFRAEGIDIFLEDFRNVKTDRHGEINYLKEKKSDCGRIVSINEKSAFKGFDKECTAKFRVTNYAPSKMQIHHSNGKHEYMITEYLLNADVIINLPKPKTHRKAGITASLKNMVGINTNKEYLPHHRAGGTINGGDEYLGDSMWHNLASKASDITEELMCVQEYEMAEESRQLYKKMLARAYKESRNGYSEGSWYGNDTIWRTIQDLNTILFYADKQGNITDTQQRKNFIIADMIVSGDKEGPLEPEPVGLIVMGYNPVIFDKCIAKIMGFDWRQIPLLKNIIIDGIDNEINEKNISTNKVIRKSYRFEPSSGWIYALGSPHNEEVLRHAKEKVEIYLFGACASGRRNADFLMKNGVKIVAFLDNDKNKYENWNYKGINVIDPNKANKDRLVIVSTMERYVSEIEEQLQSLGFDDIMTMR